jgi:hypothetical protein
MLLVLRDYGRCACRKAGFTNEPDIVIAAIASDELGLERIHGAAMWRIEQICRTKED